MVVEVFDRAEKVGGAQIDGRSRGKEIVCVGSECREKVFVCDQVCAVDVSMMVT